MCVPLNRYQGRHSSSSTFLLAAQLAEDGRPNLLIYRRSVRYIDFVRKEFHLLSVVQPSLVHVQDCPGEKEQRSGSENHNTVKSQEVKIQRNHMRTRVRLFVCLFVCLFFGLFVFCFFLLFCFVVAVFVCVCFVVFFWGGCFCFVLFF